MFTYEECETLMQWYVWDGLADQHKPLLLATGGVFASSISSFISTVKRVSWRSDPITTSGDAMNTTILYLCGMGRDGGN